MPARNAAPPPPASPPTGRAFHACAECSQLPSSIPAYLINAIPQLTLNGSLIKTGHPMRLGQEINVGFDANIIGHGTISKQYNVVAGSYLNIAVVGQSVSSAQLSDVQTKLTETKTILESNDPAQIATLTQDDLLGDMFHAGTLGYYAQYLALSHIASLAQNGHHSLIAGLGSYGYEPISAFPEPSPPAVSPSTCPSSTSPSSTAAT